MPFMTTPMEVARLSDTQLISTVLGQPITQRPTSLSELCGLAPSVNVCNESAGANLQIDRIARFTFDCARELFARALHETLSAQRIELGNPSAVKTYLQLRLGGQSREVFCVLFLDAQNRLITCEDMFAGTLMQTSVYPREVTKRALELNAAAVILAHNHPSGASWPSRADEVLTQTLKASLALVDVRVLDHFIVGQGSTLSMAEKGLV